MVRRNDKGGSFRWVEERERCCERKKGGWVAEGLLRRGYTVAASPEMCCGGSNDREREGTA